MTMLDDALTYAQQGYRVFPCVAGTKYPATEHGSHDATQDENQIRAWWERWPSANIAIATGVGLYVIDVDDPASTFPQTLPPTLASKTPRGGGHYLFRTTEKLGNTAKRLAPAVDTRGAGGYIIAPPSIVDGKVYQWVNDLPIAPLPTSIIDTLKPKPITVSDLPYVPMVIVKGYGDRALSDECDKVASTQEGGRNHQLNLSAFKIAQLVGGGQIDEHEARECLAAAAQACGLSETEIRKTIASAFSKGKMRPRLPARRADPIGGVEYYYDESELDSTQPPPPPPPDPPDDSDQWQLLARVQDLGGLCESYPAWVLDGADYPQPLLTLASLIALGSVLGSRRMVYGRATSSLYICAIARTGDGKGRPQSCLERVLREHWSHTCGPSDLSSTVSTIERIASAVNIGVGLLFPLDEYGARLKSLLDTRSGHQRDMRALLLQLATTGTGNYVAAQSMTRGGADKLIQVPAITIYGSTTPQTLHDALGQMALEDGFLGRHLFFSGLSVLPFRQREQSLSDDDHEAIPEKIEAAIQAIRVRHEEWHKSLPRVGNTDDGLPLLTYKSVTARDGGGWAVLSDFSEDVDARRRHHEDNDSVPVQMLARASEHAQRISLCLALLSRPTDADAVVTDAIARTAIAIVHASIKSISRSIMLHSAGSDYERNVKRVIAAIGECRGPDGWVSRRNLLRKVRTLKVQELDEIVTRLAIDGTVECRKQEKSAGIERISVRLSVG